MEHVVFFPAPDGSPAFRRVPTLEEAVRLVEHLRNVEGVNSVSVHALTEVPLAFRAYYRVEVPAAAEALVPAEPEPAPELAPQVAVDVEPLQDPPALALVEDVPAEEPVLVASNGHGTGHSPQSLGFFA